MPRACLRTEKKYMPTFECIHIVDYIMHCCHEFSALNFLEWSFKVTPPLLHSGVGQVTRSATLLMAVACYAWHPCNCQTKGITRVVPVIKLVVDPLTVWGSMCLVCCNRLVIIFRYEFIYYYYYVTPCD